MGNDRPWALIGHGQLSPSPVASSFPWVTFLWQVQPQCDGHSPHRATYQQLLEAYAQLGPELPEEREDVIMFNQFFSYWPQLGSAHHLEYFSQRRGQAGGALPPGTRWVHNNLTAVRFQGPFERWDEHRGQTLPSCEALATPQPTCNGTQLYGEHLVGRDKALDGWR